MENKLTTLEKIIPDGISLFKKRYSILQAILENEPIGRRALTSLTNYSERVIRSETELLHLQGFIEIASKGMSLSLEGRELLQDLYVLSQELEDTHDLEKALEEKLNLKKAIIVKGDIDNLETINWGLSSAGASLIQNVLQDGFTIAVTGGTTIYKMVKAMPVQRAKFKNITVVPARGSIGEKVEFQANTIAVGLAEKLHASYELLNIPDNLSRHSVESIQKEPHFQKTLEKIDHADVVIFGLGNALKMAKRRKENTDILHVLEEKEAIAEVFRYYFNKSGDVVHKAKNIGLSLEKAKTVPIRIAVAGGKSKADAIIAVKEILKGSYFIVDECAAKEILKEFIH
jgi:central glycolytic genes regulator